MNNHSKKLGFRLIFPLIIVFLIWVVFMSVHDKWGLFQDNWFMTVTMVFGSFIAGASAEGGAAVAFPVMTLIFNITPEVARNFGLAIQSVGMTAAAYLIIAKRFKIEHAYLRIVSIGGAIGMILGTIYIVPIIHGPYVKMLFVTFWLSFGLVLFYVNVINKRKTIEKLPALSLFEKFTFVLVGLLGGALGSLLGSGLDIFSFSYVTMRYSLSEKIATPTSVIIMAINSLVGFLIHFFVLRDFGVQEYNYWLVCIPVVVFGAPLGAYFINSRTRGFVTWFLYLVILAQFIGALIILKPKGLLLIFSVIVFFFGIFFFFFFAWFAARLKKMSKI